MVMQPKRPIRKIACIGEVMIELRPAEADTFKASVAGDTYNTAVYLSRLLTETEVTVSYMTALGLDTLSDQIVEDATLHGLMTDMIERRPDKMPGLYMIHTDQSGERSFSYWRDTSAARTLFSPPCNVSLNALGQFDLVVLSGITMAILPATMRDELIESAAAFVCGGGTLAFDSNYRPRLWEDIEIARSVTERMWGLADIALPSLDDEMALFGDENRYAVVERLSCSGAVRGALKCGAEGPFDLATRHAPTLPPVQNVVDSTAAGDSFNAGFLAAHVQGLGDPAAARAGHTLATHVIGFPGAIVPLGNDH